MSNRYPADTVQLDRLFFSIRRFFCETPSGKRETPELIREKLDDGRTLEIRHPASLGALHLLLIEALTAEAQRGTSRHKAGEKDNSAVSISYYSLAKWMGMDACTTLRKQVDRALSELKGIRLAWLDAAGKEIASCNLLSVPAPSPDGVRKALQISLCPLLSSPDPCSSTLINMDEVRILKHRASILLHGFLSSRALPGRQTTVPISDLLKGVIWPELAETRPSTGRMRKRALLKKILPDLAGAGWKADVDNEKERIRFKRPLLHEPAYSEQPIGKCSYRVFWSDEDRGYLAVCDQFPGLSCAEPDAEKALNGILALVSEKAGNCPIAHA